MASLLTNLAANWGLHGNGQDSSLNARHLTIAGTMSYTTGKNGQCATPNATNYFTYPTPTWFSAKTVFTVSLWTYGTVYAASDAVMSWGTANANQVCVLYPYQSSNGNGYAIYCNGGGYKMDLNTGVPALDSWHHSVLVVNGTSSATLYVDNVSVATSALDMTNFASPIDLRIGMYHNGGQGYTGRVEEVSIWTDRALTAEEISVLWNSGNGLTFAGYAEAAKVGGSHCNIGISVGL